MRPRSYKTVDGMNTDKDAVQWYWRLVALGSTLMILGGFLMLPATFDNEPLLRVSKSVLGIFAVALLTAGFSLTALLCFAVRKPVFQADSVFLPCATACAIGLLTIFYDFLISSRYLWNTPALLLTVAGAVSTIIYGGLLVYAHRRIGVARSHSSMPLGARPNSWPNDLPYQSPLFYENYNRNMFPGSVHQTSEYGGYDPNSITEEEMQRQQLLQLLMPREQPPTPDPSQSTFHIDWEGQEESDPTPINGFYAPNTALPYSADPRTAYPPTAYPQTAYPPQSALSRQLTQPLQPWDGVWRGPGRPRGRSGYGQRSESRESRETRRREIEMGR